MLIIPAIDLKNGKCVRLSQGRRDESTIYDDDPVRVANSFAQAGAQMLHVVDLDGAFSGSNSQNRRWLAEIARAIPIPVQFGGGLRSPADVKEVFALGVYRAIVGTLAVESPEHLREMVKSFGSDRLAVGIDAKDGEVLVRGWEQKGKIRAIDLARDVAKAGIERIIYTDVSRDGMLSGPNLEQTLSIARETGLRVTASGGVSSLNDLKRLNELTEFGVDSVIVGKALYEHRFSLAEAITAAL